MRKREALPRIEENFAFAALNPIRNPVFGYKSLISDCIFRKNRNSGLIRHNFYFGHVAIMDEAPLTLSPILT